MTDIGNLDNAINAQAVILEIDGIDEIITIHNITHRKIHPVHRTNTRGGARDNFSWALIELEFSCLVTKDMSTKFDLLNTLSNRSALTEEQFTLTGLALSGSGNDDVVSFNAVVPDYTRDAPEVGDYTARIKLRIQEAAP